jgi:hypothetical protein
MGRLLPAVLAVLAGCVSTTTPTPLPAPIEVKLKERFRVIAGARHVGFLILSQIAEERYFRVVTPTGIWVGDIHKYGRFFQCEPFRDRPRELGLFTMKEGLGKLFETDEPIRVFPLEGRGEPTEAAAQKLLKRALADN